MQILNHILIMLKSSVRVDTCPESDHLCNVGDTHRVHGDHLKAGHSTAAVVIVANASLVQIRAFVWKILVFSEK